MASLFFPVKRLVAGLVAVCLLSGILFYAFGMKQSAVVFESEDGTLVYLPLTEGEAFSIQYTHSIHLSEVCEMYRAEEDGTMTLYEMVYEDYGVGMPSEAAEGEIFTIEEGKYKMSGMERNLPFFYMRTGQVKADHMVVYGENTRRLSDVIVPGSRVKVGMDKLAKWQLWRGVNMFEDG